MKNKVTILSVVSLLLIVGVIGGMFMIFNKVEAFSGDIGESGESSNNSGSSNNIENVKPGVLIKGSVGCVTQNNETLFFVIAEKPALGDSSSCDDSYWSIGYNPAGVQANDKYELFHRVSFDGGLSWEEFEETFPGMPEAGYYYPYTDKSNIAYVSYGKIKNCSNPTSELIEFEKFIGDPYIDECSNCGGGYIRFETFDFFAHHDFIKDNVSDKIE